MDVEIIIPVYNQWPLTSRILDVLDELPHDVGICVTDDGSTDETSVLDTWMWRRPFRYLRSNTNVGFGGNCNRAGLTSKADIVVFLNNDTLPIGSWLTQLVAPFVASPIVATGPRTNRWWINDIYRINACAGPQSVDQIGYLTLDPLDDLRRFEQGWLIDHMNHATEVDQLIGHCLAVRTDRFVKIGGFDERYGQGGYEDFDLCIALRRDGGRLVISHGSYVHHDGHATFRGNGMDWLELQTEAGKKFNDKWSED